MKKIAIIGGGCSAVIVALQLLRQKEIPCEIEVFDPSEHLGHGVAYGTVDPQHCLNVPALKMGAFSDKPEDFSVWMQEAGYSFQGGDFVPRVVYAKYLTSRLSEYRKCESVISTLTHTQESVVRISRVADPTTRWQVTTAEGTQRIFQDVVLAIGLPEGGWPRGIDGLEECTRLSPTLFVENVWKTPLVGEQSNQTVGILGTGLSAIDVALSILSKGNGTNVVLLSRHGLLPKPHFSEATTPIPKESVYAYGNLRNILDQFRVLSRKYRWDAVIDAFRPHIPALWSSWTSEERRRFNRHLRHTWDIYRHRMAPHISSQISEWRASGSIQVLSGRLSRVTLLEDKIKISLRENGSTGTQSLLVDRLFNCTGFRTFSRSDYHGLLHQMQEEKLLFLDASQSGIEPAPPLSLSLQPGLYVLGALLRAVRWESIAVPELREQGRDIAHQILTT